MHGVCTLDALALDAGIDGPFRVATDARRKEVYWAAYDGSSALTRVDGPHVDRPAEVAWDGPVVGPGPQLYPDAFPDGREPVRPSAAALCRWVSDGHPTLDPAPLYLRRPDAARAGPAQDGPRRVTVLRPMRWWDIDAALVIEQALFPDAWSVETFWAELARVPETRHYLVADDDGAVVGYAGLMTVGRQADVQTVAVAPISRATATADPAARDPRRGDAAGAPRCCSRFGWTTSRPCSSTRRPGSSASRSGAATTPAESTGWSCGCASRLPGCPAVSLSPPAPSSPTSTSRGRC